MSNRSKRFKLEKLADAMFESGHVFLWRLVSFKFTVDSEFLFVVFVEANNFSDLRGCADGINMSGYGVCGWSKWVSVVDRSEI